MEDSEIRNLVGEVKRDLQRETDQLRAELKTTKDDAQKSKEKLENHDRYFYVVGALLLIGGIGAGFGAQAVLGYRDKVVAAFDEAKKKATSDFKDSLPALVGEVNPAGMIGAFLMEACPQGWAHYEGGTGRYFVGSWSSETVGKTMGKPLDQLEDRATGAHTHTYVYATVGGDGGDIAATSNGLARRSTQATTQPAVGVPPGTNAPYVSVLLCQKRPPNSR